METIKLGENDFVLIDTDAILIRKGPAQNKLTHIHFFLFITLEMLGFFLLSHLFGVGASVPLCSMFTFLAFWFLSSNQIEEVSVDFKSQELRHYYIFFGWKVKNKFLFTSTQKLNYAWMAGKVGGGEDSPPVYGRELVAYKNHQFHKDLMFFENKAIAEKLTDVFKKKLSIEIHDRMMDKHSRFVK